MKVRNWSKFQHFKNKSSMVWFKVYGRDILSDPDWHDLTSDQKATLFELWCLASERNGDLPELRKICFRLHKSPEFIEGMIKALNAWFESGSVNSIYNENKGYAREDRIGENMKEEKKKREDIREKDSIGLVWISMK